MVATLPITEANATQYSLPDMRSAQAEWASRPLSGRLRILCKSRHLLAQRCGELADAIPTTLARTRADSYVAEILPLLAACKFLENEAGIILKPRKLGSKGRPFWLSGVHTTVERAPLGVVLIIAPANYPLFLAGVQTLQALAAGNAAIWKPGRKGERVANVFAAALVDAGLPTNLLQVTDDSPSAGADAILLRPDKIFFTGSASIGREVLKLAAERTIPVVAELSGCDAAIVLPSANVDLVLDALSFGMRFNGSATCMAPRRLFLVGGAHKALLAGLRERFAAIDGVLIAEPIRRELTSLMEEAVGGGAILHGSLQTSLLKPLLVEHAGPQMRIAQADIFAPVLTVLEAADVDTVVELDRLCPFGLSAAIFGEETAARSLGGRLTVGTIIVNDLIVPTADPRVSFGGRRGSGFGATRGTEGLLEMTAAKTTAVRRGRSIRHYQPTGERHETFFASLVSLVHGSVVSGRFKALRTLIAAAARLKDSGTIGRSQ